jgi:hypothetical protein
MVVLDSPVTKTQIANPTTAVMDFVAMCPAMVPRQTMHVLHLVSFYGWQILAKVTAPQT